MNSHLTSTTSSAVRPRRLVAIDRDEDAGAHVVQAHELGEVLVEAAVKDPHEWAWQLLLALLLAPRVGRGVRIPARLVVVEGLEREARLPATDDREESLGGAAVEDESVV